MCSTTQTAELFDLQQVHLTSGVFAEAQAGNRDHLMQYDADRLLAPFRKQAGLPALAQSYGNWESSGLDGHTAGHYLSALSLAYAATGDTESLKRAHYIVDQLILCQKENGNGYIGGIPGSKKMWNEIAQGDIRASGFSLNDRWVPWYNIHKTFAGLRDAYLYTGNEKAKQAFIDLVDWCDQLVADLSDEQMQDMLRAEHGGMNEVLADAAAITGEQRYLQLAHRFSHHVILEPLTKQQDKLNGLHANTQVPKIIGFQRIAGLDADLDACQPCETCTDNHENQQHKSSESKFTYQDYHTAATYFWHAVVDNRTLAFGGNSIAEHFPSANQSFKWIQTREGPETCNTYNMLRLTEQLFTYETNHNQDNNTSHTKAAIYADFYEQALLNHILSSRHPEHGGYVYFTQARPRHYRVYSQPENAFWCCVGSGMENPGRYGQFIYAHDTSRKIPELFVNLFIPSKLNWDQQAIQVTQNNQFPESPETNLKINLKSPATFTLNIRHPKWLAADELSVLVNGEKIAVHSTAGSYASITRTWQDGDHIRVELPMSIYTKPLPYLDDYVAIMYGPVLLAAKTGDQDMPDLLAGDGRMDHVAQGPLRPLDEAPMLVTNNLKQANWAKPVKDKPLTFQIKDVVKPERYQDLKLIPFYKLHDARYMMYWRTTTPEQYADIIAEIQAKEAQAIALDNATYDYLTPGEQQPESDHGFKGENTNAGRWQDRSFRHAEGWFSYNMKTGALDAQQQKHVGLRITYFGSDRRQFDIHINGQLLESVHLNAPQPGEFVDVTYNIPAAFIAQAQKQQNGILNVRFTAHPNSRAGGIFDVRLLDTKQLP